MWGGGDGENIKPDNINKSDNAEGNENENKVLFTVFVPHEKSEGGDNNEDSTHTDDVGADDGSDGEQSSPQPQQVQSNQIVWLPNEINPPPPPLYSIKQLDFQQVRVILTCIIFLLKKFWFKIYFILFFSYQWFFFMIYLFNCRFFVSSKL